MRKGPSSGKTQTRLRSRTASEDLVRSVNKLFPNKKIPVPALTGLVKRYTNKAIPSQSELFKRLGDGKHVNTQKLTEYLGQNTYHEKGKQLTEDAIVRAHTAFCNPEGKMTFDYLMKKCDELGIQMSERVAKGIIRKFGHRKDHLSSDDCLKVFQRRYAGKQKKRTPPKRQRNANSSRK